MSSRRFGVEIECGNRNFGAVQCRELLRRHHIQGVNSVGHDGSGIEIRTRPLLGRDGFKILDELMHFLRERGCYTDAVDGMHVHHDTPELIHNIPLQAQLVRSWYDNQNLVNTFVNRRRRRYGACPPWTEDEVYRLEQDILFNGIRKNLNLNSLELYGTVEMRLHEGTLDFDKAEAWIKFGQYFISNVLTRKRPLPACADSAMLLRRIRAPKASVQRYVHH